MKALSAAFALLLLCPTPLLAAGLGTPTLSTPYDTPKLSEPLATARFFDTDNFLTTVGVKYFASQDLTLEPELGIGYHARDLELHGGMEQSSHRLHAQAGCRLSLADTLYLSAAAKLPMLTVESVASYAGDELGTRPDSEAHRSRYEFTNLTPNQLTWRGELGVHLSRQTDLSLYYDQSNISGWSTGGLHQEERIGTRFIIRFK